MTTVDGAVAQASVVVPTRDRPGALAACLAALDAQAGVAFEVVVVDDGSRDGAAVAAVVARSPRARLVRGGGSGPAAARNLGAAAAAAPVVCFTDDDCRPEPGWLAALVGRLADTSGSRRADGAAGPTVVGDPGDRWAVASQVVTNHLVTASLDAAGRVGFAPTSNLACRAAVLAALPFDARHPLAAGEDRAWCAALADGGGHLAYEPTARVHHHPALGARGFWRQHVRYGRGALVFHAGRPAGRRLQPARFYLDLVRAGFAEGTRVGVLVVVAQLATATGVAREAAARRRGNRG